MPKPDWDRRGGTYKRTDGSREVRDIYRTFHARKPKPSNSTETRPEDALGYLWTEWYNYDYGCDSGWTAHPITKITAKRVWIKGDGYSRQQRSFDRATLEREGSAFWRNGTGSKHFYTDKGKAECEARRSRPSMTGNYPLLDLSGEFTTKDVQRAFRIKSHELHPDKGGSAEQFRQLVAERDQALNGLRRAA
jgi:hypothetical protein